jgi:ABC-type uncharacterized transport system permease subunit
LAQRTDALKINEIYVALTVAMSVAVTTSMVVTLTMTGFDYEGSLLKKKTDLYLTFSRPNLKILSTLLSAFFASKTWFSRVETNSKMLGKVLP